jgi:hypothetical protein
MQFFATAVERLFYVELEEPLCEICDASTSSLTFVDIPGFNEAYSSTL